MPENEIVSANNEPSVKISSDVDKDAIKSAEEEDKKLVVQVYKRRWLMLGLYIFFTGLITSQWVQYCIITDTIARYYDVSKDWVNHTSIIFMVSYVITVLPMSYVSERIGLKWTLVLGSTFCCVGAWIKTFSVEPDRFVVTMIGQAVVSLSVVILQTTPGRVAASWFPSSQLSTATSLGIFGAQFGSCFALLFTPLMVWNHDTIEEIGENLSSMFMKTAIASTVNLMLIALVFQQDPKHPANEARALQKNNQADSVESFEESLKRLIESLKRLFKNKSFLLLCNSYGLNVGVQSAMGTLLDQMFSFHFEDSEKHASKTNIFITLTGMVGSISLGIMLDKTRKFRETAVRVYFCIICGQIMFGIAMIMEMKSIILITATFFSFFMAGFSVIGYELAAELTHPESETYVAGMLNLYTNVFGVSMTCLLEQVVEIFGDLPIYMIFCAITLIGFIMTTMTKNEERRQDAINAVIKCSDEARVRGA